MTAAYPRARRMTAKARLAIGTLCLALLTAGCSEGVMNQVEDIKNQAAETAAGLLEAAGNSVPALDQVNKQLVQGSESVLALLRELKFDLSFKENGIAFSGSQGISGAIGIEGNRLVLELASESSHADAAGTIIRIASTFSPEQQLEDRLNALTGEGGPQEIALDNGWIRKNGERIELRLETPLL